MARNDSRARCLLWLVVAVGVEAEFSEQLPVFGEDHSRGSGAMHGGLGCLGMASINKMPWRSQIRYYACYSGCPVDPLNSSMWSMLRASTALIPTVSRRESSTSSRWGASLQKISATRS